MWSCRVCLLVLLLHVGGAWGLGDSPHICIPIDLSTEPAKLIHTNDTAVRQATIEVLERSVAKVVLTLELPPTINLLLPKRCGENLPLDPRVMGGMPTRLGKYPWMVALFYKVRATRKLRFLCGGSVISEQYILTAAHCLDTHQVVVRLGDWNLASYFDCQPSPMGTWLCNPDPAQDVEYEEIIMHPDYNKRGNFSDDIALIRLARPITFSEYVQPVCLPDRDLDVGAALGRRHAVVAGWGFTEYNYFSSVLRHVSLPHVEFAACNETFNGELVGKQLCFGGISGQDTCYGDSGGPLMMADGYSPPYTQIGIVSFGSECGIRDVPAVYVSVSSYRDWIDQNMRPQHGGKVMEHAVPPKTCEKVQDADHTVNKTRIVARHCKEILDAGDLHSGVRDIHPYLGQPERPLRVYCDQTTDGGGWTVIQRRGYGTVRQDFYKRWEEYKRGFGDLEEEFWLGLDALHALTSTSAQELRIDLADWEGGHRHAKYSKFRVGSPRQKYRLTVGGYSGTAGDSLANNSGQKFSTHDSDNDSDPHNCARAWRGGWWYYRCGLSHLNGFPYENNPSPKWKGILWRHWRGNEYSLRRTTMMIRPTPKSG